MFRVTQRISTYRKHSILDEWSNDSIFDQRNQKRILGFEAVPFRTIHEDPEKSREKKTGHRLARRRLGSSLSANKTKGRAGRVL